MLKRITISLLLALLLAISLAACGGTATPAPAQPQTPAEPADPSSPAAPPSTDGVTLRLFAGNVGQELELSEAAARQFESDNPGVTVQVIDTPDFVQDRLGVYLQLFEAQSSEGDVFQIDVIWPGDLAEHFVDLNQYGAAAVAGDHFDAIIQNNTVDGALIGIPWFTDAGLLYYRTDLLEKYGYSDAPTTWDELEEMATTIQEGERADNQDFWGFVWQGNAYEGLTCDALEWVASHNGGTIVSPDSVITINNPNAIAAIDRAAGWVGTISPPGVTGYGEEESRAVWQAGNAAFMRNWPYAYSLGNAADSPVSGLFDVSPLPAGPGGSPAATLGGWQLAVSRYSQNPELAAQFALYLASEEIQKERAIVASYNPTIKSLYNDPDVLAAAPFFDSLFDVFTNAVARPSTATAPSYNQTSTLFFNAVHSVLMGSTDAQSALEELEVDLEDLLGFPTGEPDTAVGAISSGETTAEPAAPVDAMTLRLFAGNVGQELELSEASARQFEADNPGVTVQVIDTPDFVQDRLGVYLQLFEAQSSEGDVFQIDVIWPGDLAEHFVDLNQYGAGDIVGAHFPAIVENNTVDGALIGIPWFTDAGLLYYRADLLEKYGYSDAPATWDELEEMAATIQEGERADNQDFWGFVWQGNSYEGLTCDALEWVASHNGGTIVSPDSVITINNPNAIAAIDRAAGWVGTISPPGVTGYGEEESRAVWQAGNAAFMRNWPYAYSLGNAADSPVSGLFDVSPLPAGPGGSPAATLGGWQLAVSRYSSNPEMAAKFAFYLASEEVQKERAIVASYNPTIMSLYDDADVLEAAPFFGSLYDVFINAVARPSTATAPNYNQTSVLFFNAVHSVLMGTTDAEDALEELEVDLEDLLGFEVGQP